MANYSKRKKRLVNKRNSDRARLMPALLDRQQHRCFWCKCSIRVPSSTPKRDRRIARGFVHWRENGKRVKCAVASLDHLEPPLEPATTDNTVAACEDCNTVRGHIQAGYCDASVRAARRRHGKQGVAYYTFATIKERRRRLKEYERMLLAEV